MTTAIVKHRDTFPSGEKVSFTGENDWDVAAESVSQSPPA